MARTIRYKYILDDADHPTKIIVLSTYAGKNVRGIAKCSPHDEFDLEIGTKLAELRCNEKVTAKRVARATRKLAEAKKEFEEAKAFLMNMEEYYCTSLDEYHQAANELEAYTKSLD